MKNGIIFCLILIILSSCEITGDNVVNDDLIFVQAKEIEVPSYSYSQSDTVYFITNGETPDTISDRPLFAWNDSVYRHSTNKVFAAVFINEMRVEQGMIVNPSDMVWAWHSGMTGGESGLVLFSDGVMPVNGNITEYHPPLPLEKGKIYFWGVWAWDDQGVYVRYSTRPLRFYVK